MARLTDKLKHELAEATPPAIFFFIAFQVIALGHALTLGEGSVAWSTFIKATIAALVVAKVVLIVDLMPFANRFPHKPPVYNVAWKTAIYLLASILVGILVDLIPMTGDAGSVSAAFRRLLQDVVWHRSWDIQIWLLLIFTVYCSLREMDRVIGRENVRRMFFGDPAAQET